MDTWVSGCHANLNLKQTRRSVGGSFFSGNVGMRRSIRNRDSAIVADSMSSASDSGFVACYLLLDVSGEDKIVMCLYFSRCFSLFNRNQYH
jgi:hypothetical protein